MTDMFYLSRIQEKTRLAFINDEETRCEFSSLASAPSFLESDIYSDANLIGPDQPLRLQASRVTLLSSLSSSLLHTYCIHDLRSFHVQTPTAINGQIENQRTGHVAKRQRRRLRVHERHTQRGSRDHRSKTFDHMIR